MPSLLFLVSGHGAARQEALSLHWGDIDCDFGNHGIIRFLRTKSKKEQTEFLMPRTREGLLKWNDHPVWVRHRKRIGVAADRLVFCHFAYWNEAGRDLASEMGSSPQQIHLSQAYQDQGAPAGAGQRRTGAGSQVDPERLAARVRERLHL